MGSPAGIVFQIVCILAIMGVVFLFLRKNKSDNFPITKFQKSLAVFQIILCGAFFALNLSDFLDYSMDPSMIRLILGLFYDLAFLSLAVYALSDVSRKKKINLQIVVGACAALIAIQCFVFPYGGENEFKRIFEFVEGILAFLLLILLIVKFDNIKFGLASLVLIVVMEFSVAVINTVLPLSSITQDSQSIDIPLNYASLYMRPVIFSSLTLAYRVWIDRRLASKE